MAHVQRQPSKPSAPSAPPSALRAGPAAVAPHARQYHRIDAPAAAGPAARPGRLRNAVVALAAANIFYGACQWLILVVLVRTCHELEAGLFARGLAVCAPIMMCTGLQLRTLLATDTAGEFRLADYAQARVLMSVLAMLAVGTVCVAAGLSRTAALVVLLVGLVKVVESGGNLLYGYFQNREHTSRVAISMAFKGTAMLLGVVVGCLLTEHAWGAVLGMLAGICVTSLAYDIPLLVHLRRRGPLRELGHVRPTQQPPHTEPRAAQPDRDDMAATGPPLAGASRSTWRQPLRLVAKGICPGIVVGLNSLNMNIPRYVVDFMLGTAPLGIFAGLMSLMRVGSYLELALVQATQTRLSRCFHTGQRRAYHRMLGRIVALACGVGLLLTAGAWLAGDWILRTAYNDSYGQYAACLVTLMFAGMIGQVAGVLKGATDASRQYVVQLPVFLTSVVVAGVTAWLLVPRWGLAGAAWCVVTTKLTLTVGYVLVLLTQRGAPLAAPADS